MVVNNNSSLRLYTPSLPDTTKFITSFLLLLHRTIFNGRFGNFIRIVFCTHVIYFRKKKLPKPKYCSFDIQLLLKVYVIMPKRRAAAQSVQPFVFAYPTTTILLLTPPHKEDKGRSFHIQEAPTRESTRNGWMTTVVLRLMMKLQRPPTTTEEQHNWNLSVRWDNTAPNVCGLATLLLLSSRNFSEYEYAFSKCFLQQKLQSSSDRAGGNSRDVVCCSYLLLLWRNPKYGGDDASSFIISRKDRFALFITGVQRVYTKSK